MFGAPVAALIVYILPLLILVFGAILIVVMAAS